MYILATLYHRSCSWRQIKISKQNKAVKQTNKQQKSQQICQSAAKKAEVKRLLSLNLPWVRPGWGCNERVEHLPTLELIISAISKTRQKEILIN